MKRLALGFLAGLLTACAILSLYAFNLPAFFGFGFAVLMSLDSYKIKT